MQRRGVTGKQRGSAGMALVFAGKAGRSVAVGIAAASTPPIGLLVGSGVLCTSATHIALPFFPGITSRKKTGHVNQPVCNHTSS